MITLNVALLAFTALMLVLSMSLSIEALVQKKKTTYFLRLLLDSSGAFVFGLLTLFCLLIFESSIIWGLSQIYDFSPPIIENIFMDQLFYQQGLLILVVFIGGILVNFFISKITSYRTLFIAPVETFLMSMLIVIFLRFSTLSITVICLIGSITIGILMSSLPVLLQKINRMQETNNPLIGTLNILHFGTVLSAVKLAPTTKKNCSDILKEKFSFVLKYPKLSLLICLLGLSTVIQLSYVAQNGIPNYQISLGGILVLEQYKLLLITPSILLIGSVSALIFNRCYKRLIAILGQVIHRYCPNAKLAFSWLFHLKDSEPYLVIGVMISYLGVGVALYYLQFYLHDATLVLPNLMTCGLIGVVLAKRCDQMKGWYAAMWGSFFNGVALTLIPTISLYAFSKTTLPLCFQRADLFFMSQLLDIFFIF